MVRAGFEKKRRWRAWCGSQDDLDVLRRTVQEAAIETYENPESTMSIREEESTFSGDSDAIMKQFDRRTALGVGFSASSGSGLARLDNRIELDLGARDFSWNCSLTVGHSDADKVRAAFAKISDKFEPGVPWWAKIGGVRRTLLSGLLIGILIGLMVGLIYGIPRSFTPNWLVFLIVGSPVAVVAVILIGVASPAIFPALEVSIDGRSTATTWLRRAAALLLTIPVGLFVNYIS